MLSPALDIVMRAIDTILKSPVPGSELLRLGFTKCHKPKDRGNNPRSRIQRCGIARAAKAAIRLTIVMTAKPRYWPATTRLGGMRRAKRRVRRKASSMFVTVKVTTLPDSTSRYRFTGDPPRLDAVALAAPNPPGRPARYLSRALLTAF